MSALEHCRSPNAPVFEDETDARQHLLGLFGGRDRAINSDTATAMQVIAADGSINNDAVGLIIATRGALDPANSDGDNTFRAT